VGAIAWLLYDRISHLDAIAEHFDLLCISTVNELTNGQETPSHDDPQIFLGVYRFGARKYKYRVSSYPGAASRPPPPIFIRPSLDPLHLFEPPSTHFHMTFAPSVVLIDDNGTEFTAQGQNFLITSPSDALDTRLVAREQVVAYIDHSDVLHNKLVSQKSLYPSRYDYFAPAYNSETDVESKASYTDELGAIITTGTTIYYQTLFPKEETKVHFVLEPMVLESTVFPTFRRVYPLIYL
jgi:hypothetical protein